MIGYNYDHQGATIEQLSEAFYDNFDLKLGNVQVIVAGKGITCNSYKMWLVTILSLDT